MVLPHGLTCSQCVVQWTYFTGNTWGQCNNGTEGMGCGDQEMFRNCADVQINSIVGAYPPGALSLYRQPSQAERGLVVTAHVCLATQAYTDIAGMDEWCQRSCLSYPPNCPADKCQCLAHCEAVGRLAGEEGTDVFCHRNCLRSDQGIVIVREKQSWQQFFLFLNFKSAKKTDSHLKCRAHC